MRDMHDLLLGELQPDPHLSQCMLGSVSLDAREIELRIDHSEQDLADCIAHAREAVKLLPELERSAREIATEGLLPEHNDHWRIFSRARSDGAMEGVDTPLLTREVFVARLRLTALVVSAPSLEFMFDDDGLFAGHTVCVTSFDGIVLSDAQASLFG